MSLEEHLPGGFLPTTVETAAGSARARSVWPTFRAGLLPDLFQQAR
jgi:hypothetical protein